MNIENFKQTYVSLRDVDLVAVDSLCDHPGHVPCDKQIAKGPAKRNILKHGGKEFICRECHMKYDNPMNHVGEGRQTDEEIIVCCPHPDHDGDPTRIMKKACFYGTMQEPYLQTCKRCAQLGKEIPEEQREKIRHTLKGVKKSDDFKSKLQAYWEANPERRKEATRILLENKCCTGMLGKHHNDDTKAKMSAAMTGRVYSDEHRQHISEGRKEMLTRTGGFTAEHRQKLSQATMLQYARGFDPKLHHRKGWHDSPKSGMVFFRSSYEKKAYLKLDKDETVKSYKAESINICFYHPEKKIVATYLVDLEIVYIDGIKKMVEVKPVCWLDDAVVIAKTDAAKNYADAHNMTFELWTEFELFGPVYNKKHIQAFVESLDKDGGRRRKEAANIRSKRHYQNHTSTDKVTVWCDYCGENHEALRLTHDKNLARNGRYICEREGGHLAGSKPKKKKNNPHAAEGKKECNRCHVVKPFEEFGVDKTKSDGYATRCKQCRATLAYQRRLGREDC
jgi:hypothetical protein